MLSNVGEEQLCWYYLSIKQENDFPKPSLQTTDDELFEIKYIYILDV